jgi:lipid II isoglutaminyl synthase (glutamine-hydrolysing)
MTKIRLILAILIGKTILFLTRTLGIGGGAAAPGYYALKIEPDLLVKLINQIPKNIIITGTNGKTTTSRLINHFAKNEGLKVIRNTTGSNLERGLVSSLISHTSFFFLHSSLTNFDLAIWEIDEAAFNNLAPKIKPEIIVFLNVSRDQLDRYGEVDSVVGKWHKTLGSLPKSTKIILNTDDGNIASMAKYAPGKVLRFGVKDETISGETKGSKAAKLDLEAQHVLIKGLSGSEFDAVLPILHTTYPILLPLPGLYHVYDALAAILTGLELKLDPLKMAESLKDFLPAFGRVEKVKLNENSEAIISLIKNPTGATQVFKTLSPVIKSEDRFLIALNDNLADGTDVSWIWDVPFGEFKIENLKFKIIVSGTRAADMAVRLKYAGFNIESIIIENNLSKALEQAKRALEGTLFIFPTYTALLTLQRLLAKKGLKRHYWESD